jgi:hypothetical protein
MVRFNPANDLAAMKNETDALVVSQTSIRRGMAEPLSAPAIEFTDAVVSAARWQPISLRQCSFGPRQRNPGHPSWLVSLQNFSGNRNGLEGISPLEIGTEMPDQP